jgi:hypothetical protein
VNNNLYVAPADVLTLGFQRSELLTDPTVGVPVKTSDATSVPFTVSFVGSTTVTVIPDVVGVMTGAGAGAGVGAGTGAGVGVGVYVGDPTDGAGVGVKAELGEEDGDGVEEEDELVLFVTAI